MTAEERAKELARAIYFGTACEPWETDRLIPDLAAAIRAAEREAADRAYADAEDVLQRFISKQDHRSTTVYDAVDLMISEMRLRASTGGGR